MAMNALIFTYGRFNPPTSGHQQLFRHIHYYDNIRPNPSYKTHHIVGVSRTQDNKKNPLSIDRKLYWLKSFFPHINFQAASDECPSFVQMLEKHSAFYSKLFFVCGEDRIEEYKAIIDKYNDTLFQFDNYTFISSGARIETNDISDITGVSGSKMREFVRNNDKESFMAGLPKPSFYTSICNKTDLWDELREVLK